MPNQPDRMGARLADGDGGVPITVTVNGTTHEKTVSPRMLLSDFLRHELRLTGTHVGCEHGVCGCCTVRLDGETARSCLTLAVQADGAEVHTVESLGEEGALGPVQQAFKECHGLQCGYCTPGFLMVVTDYLDKNREPDLSEDGIRTALSGNLCRCTGYQNIVAAVRRAHELMQAG
ncbi:(2Fe-2S)-binding protein [Microbaculum marinum]|uniref:(2Fe-2S)-binding protein n=1 Tax=Microbaculum marinum TaxID=1764581 RepID=A0AAW9RSF1_9HYPH